MSKAPSADNSKQQSSSSSAAPVFNYAAAAAKRVSVSTSQTPSTSQSTSPNPSGSSTPATATTTPASNANANQSLDSKSNSQNANQQPRTTASVVAAAANAPPSNSKSSLPGTSSNLNPSAKPVNGAAATAAPSNQARRQSAVNLPKAGATGKPNAAINFGSVQDQNATLSSSPAIQPKVGEAPTTFGSVPAAGSEPKEKVVGGFDGKGEAAKPSTTSAIEKASAPATAAPKKALNFQNLFTKQASSGAAASSTSTNSSSTTAPAATSTPSTQNATSNSTTPGTQNQASPAPSQQSTSVTSSPSATFVPSQQNAQRNTPSNLGRPGQQQQHNGSNFQSMRSPSQSHHIGTGAQGQRLPSGGNHNYSHQNGPNQQPRSPHVPHAGMQQMHPMNSPYTNHQQQNAYTTSPMYYPQQQMYNGYGYQQPPQGWQQQQHPQQGYGEMGNATPRSPRHASMPASPLGAAGMTPSGPSSVSSPPSNFASPRGAPHLGHTPSTSASSAVGSPQQHSLGIGQPPTPGRPSPHGAPFTPSHQHTPSFGSMSPSAAKFEPTKRASSAIRIVNPETQKDIVAPKISTPTEATKSNNDSSTPKNVTASPAPSAAAPTERSAPANDFIAKVRAAAEASRQGKDAAEKEKQEQEQKEKEEKLKKEKEEKEAAEKKAAEEKAEKERKEKEEADRKEREEKEAKEKEEKEKREKEEKEKKEKEEKERLEKEAAEKKKAEEEAAAAAASKAESEKESKSKLQPIDTAKAAAPPQSPSTFRGSAADVERMAREASSVPPTPMEAPRTPVPSTPRTPGTPGFANLPAKPMSSMPNSGSSGSIKLSNEALEKRKARPVPEQLDTAAAQKAANDSPMSAASTSLNSARFIDNINSVAYPSKINSPKPGLNENAEPGKFKYDRDFLLQFMGVYKEAPQALPPLSQLGMEGGQALGSRNGQRRSSGMAPPASGRAASTGLGIMGGAGGGSAFGKGAGMGAFSHTPKTSEERFRASQGAGGMGAFGSGPMGSFSAGARSQPLSRGGSGSNAVPSREMMGSGAPGGGRSKSGRGKQRNPHDRGGGGSHVNPPEKGGPTIPMDQVAPLANSENRWMPQAAQGRGGIKENSPEMVQRKVKALLNKLTVERFESISDQILEWANKSVNENDGRTLRQVIALVFEKATDEAAWSEMYARLSQKLLHRVSPDVKDESLLADGKPVVGGQLFRKYLLSRCQEDFERGWDAHEQTAAAAKDKEQEDKAKKELNEKAEADAKEAEERGETKAEDKEAELLSDEYYQAQKAKRRGLGLIRFIGELFKLQMLTERIMHGCIKKLLSNASDPEEEEIESLCKLLTTVGKPLDTERASAHMDIYFKRMGEIANSPAINSRMRFMLLEVIELRNRKWVPRHANTDPKTISQIHEEAAKAKQQQEADAYNRAQGGRGGPMSRGGSRRGQARGEFGAPSADGFTTVGGAAPPPRPTKVGDLSGFGKIERSGSGRPLSFGHTSVFSKKNQKGSDDGSNPPTRTNSTTNMFHLLGKDGDAEPAPAESQRPKLNLAPRTKPLPGDEAGKEGEDGDEDEDEDEHEDEEAEGEEGDDGETAAPADLSDEEAKKKISSDIKEYFSVRDVEEGIMATEALPINRRAAFVAEIVSEALNRKESDVEDVAKLLGESQKKGVLELDVIAEGLRDHLEFLDDVAIDVPQAYRFMAMILLSAGFSQERIETLAQTVQGEGITPPSAKLLKKVEEVRDEA